jgi:chromosome segregation protein
VVYASGVVAAGGASASEHGLLAHKRKTREADAQLAEASAEAARLQSKVEAARSEIAGLEKRPAEARERHERAQRRLMELEVRAQRLNDERERCGRRDEILEQEMGSAGEEIQRLEGALAEAERKVTQAEERHRRTELTLERASSEMGSADHGLRELAEQVAALREDLAARRQRLENVVTQRGRIEEQLAELASRIEQARVEAQMCDRRAREAAELKATTEAELAGQLELRENRGAEVAVRERAIAERRGSLAEREEGLRTVRTELEARRQETGAAELARARGEADRQHLDDLCRQELGKGAAEAAEGPEPATGDDEIDLEALGAEIAEITEKIERIGPVNMTAIEEFSDLEERHEFLTAQRRDLTDSIDSLRETIRRINRSSRERFTQAFEAIRRNYREIFQSLFNGGRADLLLEEGEDVLECGIEIMAQPPGKRLGSVQLLSGGEKAMSAIALLFAIFRYQPSPFCLLDEVDAALDDVNIGRFARMLGEYADDTQFIIITHNKLSMEAANLLYGVTMEEPGVSKLVSLQFDN